MIRKILGKTDTKTDIGLILSLIGLIITVIAEINASPYKSHGYELYVNDVTWEDAWEYCENGEYRIWDGHLATISDKEEYDRIIEYLNSNELSSELRYIWLGAVCEKHEEKCSFRWITGEKWDKSLDEKWYGSEPTHFFEDQDNNKIEELYLCLMNKDSEWKLNDVTNDLINDYVYKTMNVRGKIGYLCEYADKY